LFVGLGLIASLPLTLGSRGYRIFGAFALALALTAIIVEYRAGKKVRGTEATLAGSKDKGTNSFRNPLKSDVKHFKAIAAMSENRVIGCKTKSPGICRRISNGSRKMTAGNVVIMGRKTFESLGKPLPTASTLC